MADQDPIRALVLDVLFSVVPEAASEDIDPAVPLRDQIEMDSVDFLNFVLALEKRTGQRLSELNYPALATLNGCVACLAAAGVIPQGA